MSRTTSHFPESIEHDFIKVLYIQTDNQMSTWVSKESVRVMIKRSSVLSLLETLFWLNLFCSSLRKSMLRTLSTL